ncbi:MAG TPA: hypothetical protein VM782_18915 [Stellaceae bacterium]|nr:hypothetical protein [Stellaceae bacterium]
MKSLAPALLSVLLVIPAMAWAGDPTPAAQIGCGVAASSALAAPGDNQATINCVGVTQEYASQLAGILTYVLQRRLDPEIVIAKLDEIEGAPPEGEPRNLTADQGQSLVQSLVAGKPATIAIVADPDSPEPGNYALAIATRVGMAGWHIEDNQIRRVVPPGLAEIHGMALAVRDEAKPPEKAAELKKAMASAKIFVPIISKPDLAADAALLWVGKRPMLNSTPTQ